MKKGIYFKEDIIEQLSQETSIPIKELKEIVDQNMVYIKKSVLDKPIVLISLPNLTKLRFNLKLGMSSKYTHEPYTSAIGKRKLEALLKKIEVLTDLEGNDQLMNFNKPMFERVYKKITRKPKIYEIYNKMYHYWAVIEKKSNEILTKIR